MMTRNMCRFPPIALAALFLFLSTPNVCSFQGHHHMPRMDLSTRQAPIITSNERLRYTRSILFQSQGVEEDFRFTMNVMDENQAATTRRRRWLSRQAWSQAVRVDKEQIAELGISFMLTYNLVSNINGSIFLSLAWYITSLRTGLSPLAAGQWKGLLGTYAGLYVFITLFRPLRLALAVGLTNKVAQLLDQTQERFGCSKPVSAMMVLSAMLSFWVIFATCGITLASTLAGVPIWKGI